MGVTSPRPLGVPPNQPKEKVIGIREADVKHNLRSQIADALENDRRYARELFLTVPREHFIMQEIVSIRGALRLYTIEELCAPGESVQELRFLRHLRQRAGYESRNTKSNEIAREIWRNTPADPVPPGIVLGTPRYLDAQEGQQRLAQKDARLQFIGSLRADGSGHFFSRHAWNEAEARKEVASWFSGESYTYTPPPDGIPE